MRFSGCFHPQRLMGPAMVVELNPIGNDSCCMLLRFKSMSMDTLFFQSPNQPLYHAVLLRTMWRDKFLSQSITLHQLRVVAAGEHQPVIGTQQERCWYTPKGAEPGNQRLLERRSRRRGLARARQLLPE